MYDTKYSKCLTYKASNLPDMIDKLVLTLLQSEAFQMYTLACDIFLTHMSRQSSQHTSIQNEYPTKCSKEPIVLTILIVNIEIRGIYNFLVVVCE